MLLVKGSDFQFDGYECVVVPTLRYITWLQEKFPNARFQLPLFPVYSYATYKSQG
jgi:hypothetical protein